MKKIDVDWNYWIVRFLFLVAVIVGFKIISNFHIVMESVKRIITVLSPFILGFILAYLLNGGQKSIESLLTKINLPLIQKRRRGLSILILYTLGLLLIFLILNYIVPLIVTNLFELINLLPAFYTYLTEIAVSLEDNGIIELIKLEELLTTFTASYSPEKLLAQGSASLASLGLFAKSISSTIINTFLTFVISIYVLLFKDSIIRFFDQIFTKLIPQKTYHYTKKFVQHSNDIFYKFIITQFIDACILGTIATILLTLLGVQFALTFGLLLGICNMIPYFGSIFASVITMIVTFFTGGLNLALITIISLLILQQIDGNIIGPRIMGGALDLNPILIIISITVGGAFFGILGMFLSVPAAAILKIIIMNWLESPTESPSEEITLSTDV